MFYVPIEDITVRIKKKIKAAILKAAPHHVKKYK